MKPVVALVLIAAAHIAFLFDAYGSKFLGISPPYTRAIGISLGASTVAAGIGYSIAAAKLPWFSVQSHRSYLFATCAAAASLYVGIFLAFNTFGT